MWNPHIWSLEGDRTEFRYQVEYDDVGAWVTLLDDLYWVVGGGNPTNRFVVMPAGHRPTEDLWVEVPEIPEVDLYINTDGRLYLAPELPAGVTHVPLLGLSWPVGET